MRLSLTRFSVTLTAQKCPRYNLVKKFFRATHCIFDLDGTLLDTRNSYEYSCNKMFKKYGVDFTPEWHRRMLELSSQQFWKYVKDEFHLPSPWRFMEKEWEEIYKRCIDGAPLKVGAEKLITHLYHYKIPMAIATSSDREVMEWKTKHIQDIMGMFSHVLCADSNYKVKRLKPNPDIYLASAARFAERPVYGNCLVFEDTPRGITAAISAGMQCVAIPNHNVPRDMCEDATLIINSFMEFDPDMFGLPSYTVSRPKNA